MNLTGLTNDDLERLLRTALQDHYRRSSNYGLLDALGFAFQDRGLTERHREIQREESENYKAECVLQRQRVEALRAKYPASPNRYP